ncbi:hypothetical protein HID58_083235 [Brassica napus]|uniref:2-isopropylmalate synthase LeuA allosteric (dimerisation) domain-containing protein n=2 Tax=Brassica napus TaxID=3708 RepID=A0ABQ7YE87_BRANA|nr:hypothetical protein HID58_083235 [Brassica napus]
MRTVKQLTSQEQRKSDGHLALKDSLTEMSKCFQFQPIVYVFFQSVTDAERIALVSDEVFQPEAVWKLLDIQIICATMELSTETVTLADADGKEHGASSRGTCPVKSAFKAVDLIVKEPTTLLEYSMDTATEGTDAIATTRVLVRGNALTGEEVQRNFSGTGARMNVVVSGLEAYIEALNKMLDFKEKFLLETSKSLPE